MSESSSTPWPTSGSALHEGEHDNDLTEDLDLGFDGAEDVLRAWRRGMRPDADLTVSEWADAHRWLSSRAAAEPGRYRTARAPYDAQLDQYGDILKAGVIDPTKVVRIALEYAASVAGLLVTTEAMVADKPAKPNRHGIPDMEGMEGMM